MEDHNHSLKRKRFLTDPGEDHDKDPVGVCSPSKLAETTPPLCYGTIVDVTLRIRQWPDARNEENELSSFNRHPVVAQGPATPVPEQGDNATEISNVLSSLSHHAILSKKAGTLAMKIRTQRMEGLYFISRRETGNLPPELTLWVEVEDENGERVYQHTIIGARRPCRLDIQGGILADEMGVGKTIVALANIAASLDRAANFATSSPEYSGNDSGRRRSKAGHLGYCTVIPALTKAAAVVLIDSWVDEIRKHIYPGNMTFYKYHGRQRKQDANLLFERDVVFSTYATLASEPDRGVGILKSVEWFRKVLDEAHEIRNTTTKQFQAVFNLAAQHRWCLTGTPIQNSVEDLGALISFLRVPLLEKPSTFRRYMLGQARQGSRNPFKNLRLLLNSICLRRTKDVAGMSDPVLQTRALSRTPTERRDYVELLGGRGRPDLPVVTNRIST